MEDLNLIGQYFYQKIALHMSIPETTHDYLNERQTNSNVFSTQFGFKKVAERFFPAFKAESEKVLAKK